MLCSVAVSCPTLWGPLDCGPPGSSVHGTLQARILGWIAIPFSIMSMESRQSQLPARQGTHHEGSVVGEVYFLVRGIQFLALGTEVWSV